MYALKKYLVFILLVFIVFLAGSKIIENAFALGESNNSSNWTQPNDISLKQVTTQIGPQHEPYYFENIDCTLVEYRQVATSNLKTGCFTPTDYGMIDSDNYTIIFNGSDEGIPITTYSNKDIILPWQNSTALLQMTQSSGEGTYLSMYKNPVAIMQDKRNLLMQITGKQLTTYPESLFSDSAGNRLIINPQTIAFSSDGSWMVAETIYGSFVRVNVATNSILAFAPAFSRQGISGLLYSQIAISNDGNKVAISNKDSRSFKVYDLTSCNSTVMNTRNFCKSYDYMPIINSKISTFSSIKHVRFVDESLISFEVQSNLSANSGIYLLSPNKIVNYSDYLGLGDSYTSGEGAFDYLAGTDTDTNHCHLSAKSYPLLIQKDLYSIASGHSVACSGARIEDVVSTNDDYIGQVDNIGNFKYLKTNQPELLNSITTNFLPGYIAQNKFIDYYRPKNITVSVGGNDVGFGDILEACALPKVSIHASTNVCFNTYEDRLEMLNLVDNTKKRWVSLFQQIKSQAPDSSIYALGYPIMISDKGSCGFNVHLNKSEIEFINEMVVYINNAINESTKKAGINYIDVENAFAGSRLCEADAINIAMNGLTAGKDDGPMGLKVTGSESYHPNARGHELLEQAVISQTHNFQTVLSKNLVNNKSKIVAVPKTGREIVNRVTGKITSKVIKKGSKIKINVKGSKLGAKAKTKYAVKIGGTVGKQISEVLTDENGDINTSVDIPADIKDGVDSIDVVGQDQGNGKIDITQPIYVPVSSSDSDGDGISDNVDSCPTAVNSGIDVDKDGIDDVCDSNIMPVNNNTSQNSTSSTSSSGSNNNIVSDVQNSSYNPQNIISPGNNNDSPDSKINEIASFQAVGYVDNKNREKISNQQIINKKSLPINSGNILGTNRQQDGYGENIPQPNPINVPL
jgi:lysophospholipase L1-like esterase